MRRTLLSILQGIAAFAAVVSIAACRAAEQSVPDKSSLAGTWVQVYPADGFGDSLVLVSDGSLRGYARGLDKPDGYVPTRWHIGEPAMPGGLCFVELPEKGPRGSCQGFVRAADTLRLANQRRTVFLLADDHVKFPAAAWPDPRGSGAAPAPGESVATRAPSGMRAGK